MVNNTVGNFIMTEKGINNVDIVDGSGRVISNSYDSDRGFIDCFDMVIKSSSVQCRGNYGVVATLVV